MALLVLTSAAAVAVLVLRLLVRDRADSPTIEPSAPEPLRELFESAGPAVATISLDGRLTFINPAGERMLGYHSDELMNEWSTVEILAPGEGMRLVAEMEKLSGICAAPMPESSADRVAGFMQLLRTLPPSRATGFDAQLRRKDGELVPVTAPRIRTAQLAQGVTGLVRRRRRH